MNTLFKLTFGLLFLFVKFVVLAIFADGGKSKVRVPNVCNYKYMSESDEYINEIDFK